ncbi:FMN-binding protein [Mycetocola saprophilus]|uniref:FMN-binding protein n=1 Tax=Mycetocola saprophilus TaxID=76636 RepID=UPI0004BE8FD9|nr:hypothetical protein [Mycetocola saprophilus]
MDMLRTPGTVRTSALIGIGVAAIAALSGCATGDLTKSGSDAGSSTNPSAPAAQSQADPGASPAAGALKDGTYSADGNYTSPGGQESIGVTVTLKAGVVSDVKVVPKGQNPTAKQFESQFASGIAGQVVGKNISDLNVGTVSGSSLTGEGFNDAINNIISQAK